RVFCLGACFLSCFVETRVVHRDRSLRSKTGNDDLVTLSKHTRLRMTKEQAAEHLARARDYGNCQVARHGQVALRHAVIWRTLPVARIFFYVVNTHDCLAAKSWAKEFGRTWHREMRKRLARHTGERVEHVRRAFFIQYVVEERSKTRAGQLSGCVSYSLHGVVQIKLGRDGFADLVE